MEIPATPAPVSRPAPVDDASPRAGNSDRSVGHTARAAVDAARAAGADLPRAAQGIAASAIARGVEVSLTNIHPVTGPEPSSPAEGAADAAEGPSEPGGDGPEDGIAYDTVGTGPLVAARSYDAALQILTAGDNGPG